MRLLPVMKGWVECEADETRGPRSDYLSLTAMSHWILLSLSRNLSFSQRKKDHSERVLSLCVGGGKRKVLHQFPDGTRLGLVLELCVSPFVSCRSFSLLLRKGIELIALKKVSWVSEGLWGILKISWTQRAQRANTADESTFIRLEGSC